MNVFDLFARLSLDTSGYERSLENAKKQSSVFGDVLKANLATDVIKRGFDVASNAISKFTTDAVSTGQQFDASMSQVAATMGVTVDEIQNLRDFAQEMGATTAFSASQAADALNFMALAGYDAETSISMLPNVLNLAAAGGMDLARASDMITDSQSALGLSLDETSELVDKMAKAASKTNTSVAQLGDAILTVGGTAKNLSGGTTELAQVLGIMADNGIKASESGTHLRNIMLAMTPSTEDAAKAMAQIGLNAYDAEGNLRPLEDVFLDMNAAMEGMTDLDKQNIITAIFNKTDLAAVNALLSTSANRWDEVAAAIDDAGGAAAAMADTQLDNLQGSLTLLQSAFEGFQILISDQVTPAFKEFVDFGANALSNFNTAFKENGFEGLMQAVGTALSDGIAMIAEMLPKAIEMGVMVLNSLGQGIIDNLPTIIDSAVEIILTISNAIIENLPIIIDAALQIVLGLALGLANALPELIPTIVDVVLQIVDTFIDNIDKIIDAGIAILIGLIDGITKAIPKLLEKAPIIIQKLVTALSENAPKLIDAAITIITMLTNFLVEPQNMQLLIDAQIKIIGAVVSALIDNAPMLVDAAIQIISALAAGLIMYVSTLTSKSKELVEEFVKSFDGMAIIKKLHDIGWGIIDKVAKGIADTIMIAKDWGKDLIDNFIAGIKGKLGEVTQTFDNIGYLIKERIGFSEPEKGPLSDFHTYAPDMIDLFVKGIKDNKNLLQSAVENAFDFSGITTGFTASISSIKNATQEIPTSRVATVTNGFAGILPNLANLGTLITSPSYIQPTRQENQMVTIELSIDGKQFGRIVTPLINAENERLGTSLAY